jgi:ATP-dependent DNA helicase RecG
MILSSPLTTRPRVGATLKKNLAKLGLTTVRDLLWYFPTRYEDFRKLALIRDLVVGEQVTIKARIELIANKKSMRTRRTFTECLAADETGRVRIMWFNQPYISQTLAAGDVVFLSGKITLDHLGPIMLSPSFERATIDAERSSARLAALYPLTQGLTQKTLRSLVALTLPLTETIRDFLPNELRTSANVITLGQALHDIHQPETPEVAEKALRRLKFDELFLVQLHAALLRQTHIVASAPAIPFQEETIKTFVAGLPFSLTTGQRRSAWEIIQDMGKPTPMNRLLSGDVGSGKTLVAALAILNAARGGFQSTLMVPTEILAAQHFESLSKLLASHGITTALYTRTQKKISPQTSITEPATQPPNSQSPITNPKTSVAIDTNKKTLLSGIKDTSVNLIIGTQALLSDGVEFNNLGLVIVDEQHRFGVEQRRTIKEKGEHAHFLSMTATPIPRSLALMIYGDLEVSMLNELPAGRKPIITRLVEAHNRQKAYDFIRAEVQKGRQVFVICPLITIEEPSEDELPQRSLFDASSEKKTVMSEYKKLSENIFPELRVGFLHGKMKSDEKDLVMKNFAANELQILVSTSVVEVGVNIPNATVMMIEGAERFGLAQLHQFRGRVGRSDHQSYCFLFTDSRSPKSAERLKFFETCRDGFKLAEKDLEIRGPGQVYGLEQSGMQELQLAKLTDTELVKLARDSARSLAPRISEFPLLAQRVSDWETQAHFE